MIMILSKGRRDIVIILVAAILMTIAAGIQYVYMRNSIVDAAMKSAKSDLTISKQQIETDVTSIETAVNTMSYAVLQGTVDPNRMYDIAYRVIQDNPLIKSCTVAFTKGYFSPQRDSLFAPCSYREGQNYNRRLVGDYLQEPWYDNPAKNKQPQWSEPFIEKGPGERIVTYSYPVTDRQGKVVAVLAANVLVDSLTKAARGVDGYPSSYAVLTSKDGHQISGGKPLITDDNALTFTSNVGKVGWLLTIVCPNKDINQKTVVTRYVVLVMQLLSLLLLLFIVVNTAIQLRRFRQTTEERNRMGSELDKAKSVQEAMQEDETDLPCDERLTIEAKQQNASEVGGDFYDCFTVGDRFYFCIGDVAGKGVPAALLMSMARSAFRVSAQHQTTCADIMAETNRLVCKMNDGQTTIKMTGGILDLNTGTLHYCNAGMHTPFVLTPSGAEPLGQVSTKRMGVSEDSCFEEETSTLSQPATLFLYTDGLTEAENYRHEQWGSKRLNTQLNTNVRLNPKELLERIERAVKQFTEGTALPDDLTMLAIQYKTKQL